MTRARSMNSASQVISWGSRPPLLDIGYRNTAAALAELIDNSIDAGAKDIEILEGL